MLGGRGPVIRATQSIEFGALTAASAGGFALALGGSASASIDSGNGSSHWQISSAGVLTPTAGGDTADLNSGPYTLGCTVNGVSVAVTIAIIAGARSVANVTELKAACEHASLALGQQILLRSGLYNAAQADTRVTRATAPTGTFTEPSLIDEDHPDKGLDPDTANYVVIKPHTGADPRIHYLAFYNTNGGSKYFRFTGLKLHRPPLVAGNLTLSGLGGTGILFINGCTDCAVDNCEVWSQPNDAQGLLGNLWGGIGASGAGTARIIVRDNYIHDVSTGVSLMGDGCQVVGNRIRRTRIDGIQMKHGDDFLCAWNNISDLKNLDAAIGAHPDFLQLEYSAAAATIDSVRIVGNLCWRGDGSAGLPDAQGFFSSGLSDPNDITNLFACGNLYYGCFLRGISFQRAVEPIVRNNTVLFDLAGTPQEGTTATEIRMEAADGGVFRDNIAKAVTDSDNRGSADIGNNVVSDEDEESGAASYEALFAAPQIGAALTDPLVQFAIKAGSAADVASPKAGAIGTGYVDFGAREYSFPWAA